MDRLKLLIDDTDQDLTTPPGVAAPVNTSKSECLIKRVKILHLKTQDNQPYGSVRRCCEICGTMIWNNTLPEDLFWTADRSLYTEMIANQEYVYCGDKR